jgi:hypothetical protein
MLGTNAELRTLLAGIDREMREREMEISWAGESCHAVVERLGDLRDIHQVLVDVLRNRTEEAAKPIVDFARWLSGNGALYERAHPADGAREARQPSPSRPPVAG